MPGLFNLPSPPASLPYWLRAFGLESSFAATPITNTTVTYALIETGSTPFNEAYRTLSAGEIANIENALDRVAEYSGLTFVEGTVANADMVIGASSVSPATAYGRTWQYTTQAVEVVAYDDVYSNPSQLASNSYIYVHEILHGVGLDHSTPIFGNNSPDAIPVSEATGTTLFGSWSSAWTGDIQLFDIAATQYLYGVDPTLRSGNDTYNGVLGAFDPSFPNSNTPLIYDGDGNDRIVLTSASGGAVASLAPGVVSYVDVPAGTGILEAGTFSINFGTEIERLIGTAFDDVLSTGSHAGRLDGLNGNDILNGDVSRDRLDGDRGHDTLDGGHGNDTLNGDNGRDALDGGRGRDVLNGGLGRDVIEGQRGDDTITGGAQADTFVFDASYDNGTDVITDFEHGLDEMLFEGVSGIGDLTFNQVGADVQIDWAQGSIVLENTVLANVTPGDVVFV